MSNDTTQVDNTNNNNTTDNNQVDDNNNDQEIIEEEQPKVYELTATDHINKNMLEMFKQRIESGQFQFTNQDDEEDSNDEFADEEDNDINNN